MSLLLLISRSSTSTVHSGTTTGAVTKQITGLTPSSTYDARVRARDAAGNWGPWSSTYTFSTVGQPAPATVAGSTSIPGPSVIVPAPVPATVAGTTSIPTPYAGFVRSVTVGNVTTGQVTGLTAGRNYRAQVRARDAAGNWGPWSAGYAFTTGGGGTVVPATVLGSTSIATPAIGGTPPTLVAGIARPVAIGSSVLLDVGVTPPGGATISSYSWAIQGGGAGSLTNATTATPTYTPPGTGSGLVTIRATVSTNNGGTAFVDMTVSYHTTVVAAENALTGTARATWDLADPNLGGVSTLQGFCDGFTADKTSTINFKIGQSDTAGWTADVYRLGYYGGNGARFITTLTPSGSQLTASQAQPTPGDADPNTTLLSADASNWATTLTWTPPAWVPSGFYILRLNRTGGGASHVMFIVRDDARAADIMCMPSDSTWSAYNAWGGLGGSMYSGNSLYLGTAVNQYDADCARYVSYNRPFVNRGAADTGRSYGAVEWSTFFTGEYPMVRFLERNGYDVKYYGCIDAGGDPNGTHLLGNGTTRGAVKTALMMGHNEYWSDNMRSGWEYAKNRGVNIFTCASNEVFWRLIGSNMDSEGRPRTWECFKSTIAARSSTGRTQWTGTWRDSDGAGKGGNNPENTFTGTIYTVNGADLRSLVVPFTGGYSAQPIWRNSTVGALASGSYTSSGQIIGFEWDTYGPAGVNTTASTWMAAPHPRARYCSDSTYSVTGQVLTDAGDVYGDGTVTHRLVVHPGGAGSLCFATGTINWALGLDNANTYQLGIDNTDANIRQATINMLTDMGATAATPMAGMTVSAPVDWYPDIPTSTVVATTSIPAPTVIAGTGVNIQPATVAGTTTVPAPVVRGAALATPATVTGTAAVGTAALSSRVTATPATVAGATTVPAVALTSPATVTPATVAGTATVPTATLSSLAAVTPATVAGTATVPSATLTSPALATPATVTGTTNVPAVAVQTSSGTTVAPGTVSGAATVPTPTVQTSSAVTVQPATVAGTTTVPAPAVKTGAGTAPATVLGVTAVPGPALTTSHTLTPATVQGTATVPAASIQTSGNVSYAATTVAGSTSIPTPTVTGPASVTAVTVAGATTVPAATVRTGATATPGVVAGSTSIPTPTVAVSSTSTATPATVAGTTTVGAPGTGAATTAQPGTIAGGTTIPAPSFTVGAAPSPATLAGQATIGAVAVLTSSRLTAVTVIGSTTVPGPSITLSVRPTPATVAGTATMPAPTLTLVAVATPATVQAGTTIGQISHVVGQVVSSTGTATVGGSALPGTVIGTQLPGRIT